MTPKLSVCKPGTGEGNERNIRMCNKSLTCTWAQLTKETERESIEFLEISCDSVHYVVELFQYPTHDINHAVGKANFLHDFAHVKSSQRRHLAWLTDYCVSN